MYTKLMSTGVVLLHFVKRFVTLQKKITLVIAKKPFNAHTKPIGIENYLFQIEKFMEHNSGSNRANNQT